MFDNKEHKQLEFFEELAKPSEKKNKRFGFSLTKERGADFKISYDKIILFVIVFVLALTLVFSLGVEQGKEIKPNIASQEPASTAGILGDARNNMAKEKTNQVIKEERNAAAVIINPVVENKPAAKKTEIKSAPSLEKKLLKGTFFTIQAVTYKDKEKAKREKNTIEKSGLRAFITKSGKYFLVCAGDFDDISAAQKKLPFLKKTYKDCFVKKMKKADIYRD